MARCGEACKMNFNYTDKIHCKIICFFPDFDFPDLENYEQIFDSHISQTFVNLFGGNEKHAMQSGVNEESLVMATPRRRRVEPETETIPGGNKAVAAADVNESMFIMMHSYFCFELFGWNFVEFQTFSVIHALFTV